MKIRNIALAVASLAATTSTNVPAKAAPGMSISTKQKEGVVKPVRSARQIVREDAGGLQVISMGNGGVPPHIYGQNFVRRGTHKKTNK